MSDDGKTIEFDDKRLVALLKAFGSKIPVAKLGILSGKAGRALSFEELTSAEGRPKTLNNAEIGAKHEFGLDGMPVRSFLRMPVIEHMQEAIDKSGAFDPGALAKVIKEGSVREWVTKIAILGEAVVAEAFATGGYGKWAAWRAGYTNRTGMLLQDTTQLRNSISSEVK